jgi:undecaprenyl-diphosphatase
MDIQHLDMQILLLVNQGTANALFDILMPALSLYGYLLVVPFVLALFPWSIQGSETGTQRPLWYVAGVVLISCSAAYAGLQAEHALKNAIARVRPCNALEGIRLVISCPRSYSMPSGHAISSFAFIAPIMHLLRQTAPLYWRPYPFVLATLICFSRIYLGVHYPSDVLAGAAAGAAIGLGLSLLFKQVTDRRIRPEKR